MLFMLLMMFMMLMKFMLLNCQKRLWLNSSEDTLTAFVKDNVSFPLNRLWHRSWWFEKEVDFSYWSSVIASLMTFSELEFVTFSTKSKDLWYSYQSSIATFLSPCSLHRAGSRKVSCTCRMFKSMVWGNGQDFSVQHSSTGYQCNNWIIFIRLFELMEAFSSVFVDSLKHLFVYL